MLYSPSREGILAKTEAGAGTVTHNSTVPCQLAHRYCLVVLVMPGKLSITVHTGVSALLLMSHRRTGFHVCVLVLLLKETLT